MAIAEAENEVIFRVVEEESPDLTPADMSRLGGAEMLKGVSKGRKVNGNGYSRLGESDEDIEETDEIILPLSIGMVLRALVRNKKDVVNVLGSAAIMGMLIWRFVESRKVSGGNWFILTVVAWVSSHPLLRIDLKLMGCSVGLDIHSDRRQTITIVFVEIGAASVA